MGQQQIAQLDRKIEDVVNFASNKVSTASRKVADVRHQHRWHLLCGGMLALVVWCVTCFLMWVYYTDKLDAERTGFIDKATEYIDTECYCGDYAPIVHRAAGMFKTFNVKGLSASNVTQALQSLQ